MPRAAHPCHGQGVVAGIGYRIVGVTAPVLLAALTAVLSLIPLLGTALVWGPLAVCPFIKGEIWRGVGMLAWRLFLVHPIDNLLHPLLISGRARAPFLLVLFGVLGGLAAFGFVGLFVGPILLRLASLAWQEWAAFLPQPQAPP